MPSPQISAGEEAGCAMWKESEDAIGDLLMSNTLQRKGRIDHPEKVSSWWADNGVNINADELSRDVLFALAEECREFAVPDWVSFLWHVLAWGVVGDYRNARAIVKSATNDVQHTQLNAILSAAAAASYSGAIRLAYTALHGKIPRLGPAFFSKFLYFTADRTSPQPRCLILDSRVAAAVFTLTGLDYFEEKAATYERFCQDVHRWSVRYEVVPDLVEFRLYQFGQLINSRRWKWLYSEVSRYREGNLHVEFDNIIERRAQVAGWTR
jgi:hypothetical protein